MVLPDKVRKGIEDQFVATQKARQRENEVAEAAAERLKQKEVADGEAYTIEQKAQAEATAIKAVQEQLSKSPQYIEYLKATKWDGKLPVYTNGVPMMKLTE
jgi:regulator of protease activity HflC (stomatin/prohibitin superfamily)